MLGFLKQNMWPVKSPWTGLGRLPIITLELGNWKNRQNERKIVNTRDDTKVSNSRLSSLDFPLRGEKNTRHWRCPPVYGPLCAPMSLCYIQTIQTLRFKAIYSWNRLKPIFPTADPNIPASIVQSAAKLPRCNRSPVATSAQPTLWDEFGYCCKVSMDISGFRVISGVRGRSAFFKRFGWVAEVSLVICGYFRGLVLASCAYLVWPWSKHGIGPRSFVSKSGVQLR